MENSDIKFINTQVEHAGLYYIPHYNKVELRINGSDWDIKFDYSELYDLINIFDIPEDGCFIADYFQGKYLRIGVNVKTDKIEYLEHIIYDSLYKINKD